MRLTSFSMFFDLIFFLILLSLFLAFFFFNDTATTEIYTLSLHDALPISRQRRQGDFAGAHGAPRHARGRRRGRAALCRSEEHTSELQSPDHLVCRLLLEKKKKKKNHNINRQKNHLEW